MRFFADDIDVIVDISVDNSGVAEFIADFNKSAKVTIQNKENIKTGIVMHFEGERYLYLCSLGAETVRRRLNKNGFIFI